MSAESAHPFRIPIVVALKSKTTGNQETQLYISPEWLQPEQKAVAEDLKSSGFEVDWEWSGSESMNPFWAVRRMTDAQLAQEPKVPTIKGFNVQLSNKEFSQVVVGTMLDDIVSTTWTVTVPVLSNEDHISQGDELILRHEPIKKKEPKAKSRNWETDIQVSAAEKKRRAPDADSPVPAKVTVIWDYPQVVGATLASGIFGRHSQR